MKFQTEVVITGHAPDRVVYAMMHQLDTLADHMSNVAEIETRTFEEASDGSFNVVRWWLGTTENVPKLLRPFMNKNSLWWLDYSVWTPAKRHCSWRIESKHSKLSSCQGETWFEPHPEDPGATRMLTDGELVVFGDKLPGPAFLGRKIAPQIEKIVVRMTEPNIVATGVGLQKLLDSKAFASEMTG